MLLIRYLRKPEVKSKIKWAVIAIVAALWASMCAQAQAQVAVTATITDSDGIAWANGVYTFNIYNPGNRPMYINGVPQTITSVAGALTKFGILNATVPDNNLITPANTKWTLTVCSYTSAACSVTAPFTITGATDNITSTVTSQLTAPRFAATSLSGSSNFGYSDTEIQPVPNPGQIYFNVTSGTQRVWNGTAFQDVVGLTGNITSLSAVNASIVTLNNSGTLTSANINGVINAALEPGADLGAKVAAAVTQLNGVCGKIYVPLGTYNWTTPNVQILPCQTLDGDGATVNVNVGANNTAPFLLEGGVPNYNSAGRVYAQGGIDNITFLGPGGGASNVSTGIFMGADILGNITPATWSCFLTGNYNLHLEGFNYGIEFGNATQVAFFNGSIASNNTGIYVQPSGGSVGLENMSFHGTQIINNVYWGIDHSAVVTYVELNLTDTSIDYNGEGQPAGQGGNMRFINGLLNMDNGHLEGTALPFITFQLPNYPTATVEATIKGVGFNDIDSNSAHTYGGFIEDDAFISTVFIGQGNSLISQGAVVDSFVHTAPTASGSTFNLYSQPYVAQHSIPDPTPGYPIFVGLPAWSGTLAPLNYSYPVFSSNGQLLSMNVSHGFNVAGNLVETGGLQIGGFTSSIAQGLNVAWNKTNGSGTTVFYNDAGIGLNGGFEFHEADGGTDDGLLFRVGTNGTVIAQGAYQIGASGVTWTSGSGPPPSSCGAIKNGSMYSNTSGGTGSTFYTCVAGTWTDIK
jgi:hypothetical protein